MKIIYLTKNKSFEIPILDNKVEAIVIDNLTTTSDILNDIKLLVIDNVNSDFNTLIKKIDKSNNKFKILLLVQSQDFNILNIDNPSFQFLISPYTEHDLSFCINSLIIGQHLIRNYETPKELINIIKVIFNNSKTGFVLTSNKKQSSIFDEKILYVNPAFNEISKMNLTKIKKLSLESIIHPDDLKLIKEKHSDLVSGKTTEYDIELRAFYLEKHFTWLRIKNQLVQSHPDGSYLSLYIINDITRRKKMQDLLEDTSKSVSILTTSFPGVVYRSYNDEEWTFQYLSIGVEELTGYSIAEFIDQKTITFNMLILPKYRNRARDIIDEAIKNKTSFNLEYQIKTKDGQIIWVLEKGGVNFDKDGNTILIEGVIFNIDKEKQKEAALVYNLNHHYLTNFHNRSYLERFLEQEASMNNLENAAILKLKVIYLRDLVKYYGMQYVNNIIRNIANSLRTIIDNNTRVFSSQDNHFVIYIDKASDNLENKINEIKKAIKKYLSFEQISFSLGVMNLKDYNFVNSDNLLKHILITVDQEIKEKSPLTINEFDLKMLTQNDLEKDVIDQLEDVLKRDNDENFYIVAQPVLDLKNDRIIAVEVLSRLNHPTHGFISPLLFIKLAEQTKLIDELGLLIFKKTFYFMNYLKEEGLEDILVSINISAIQLNGKNFTKNVTELIKEFNINPRRLIFELTESVLVTNVEVANRVIKEMKSLGITISIDDFGTGFSSLDIQDNLDIDVIKIDKSFTKLINSVDDQKSIIKDIVSMSHRLGRLVVTEGVEKQIDIDYLKANNCDFAQGYFISKPLKSNDAIKFLKDNYKKIWSKDIV